MCHKPVTRLLMAIGLALLSLGMHAFAAEDFTLIALPDTQMYSQNHPQIWLSQAEWIAANKEALNIQMVLHEGDVVNKGGNDAAQWPNAKAAIDIIDDAGVPLFIAMGNHDYDDMAKTRGSSWFNRFFGIERYTGKPWFGGAFEPDKADNVYGVVSAGGRDYLIFTLEFAPRRAVVAWASEIIAQHPEHDVMIVTHNYLYSDGTHHDRLVQNGTYGVSNDASTGLQLWTDLVSQHKNTVLVLSGHVGGDGLAQRTDFGVHGNMVHQVEANYQFIGMGGQGYLRIMRFRPSAGVIEVKTYSPYLDRYQTDAANEFVLPYNPSNLLFDSVQISGQVIDRARDQGLPGALITLQQGQQSLNSNRSGEDGRFTFHVPPGEYTLRVSASNLPTSSVKVDATSAGETYEVEIPLGTARDEVFVGLVSQGGALTGNRAEATPTDILMRNGKLAFVIANTFEDPQLPGATRGKPIDMAVTGQEDGIDWMNMPFLSLRQPTWANSGALTTVQYNSVRVVTATPEKAVVEAEGIYTEVPGVTVRTTYTLLPNDDWVYALTTVSNPGDQDLTLWAGDTMDNDDGKQYVFVPGRGDLGPGSGARREYKPNAPWVGHYGDADQGYAFVYDDSFEGFIHFGANITIMTQRQITIPAGGSYEFGRYIVAVPSAGHAHKMDAVAEAYERIRAVQRLNSLFAQFEKGGE